MLALYQLQLETLSSLRLDTPPAPAAFNRSLLRYTACDADDAAFDLPSPCAMLLKIDGEVLSP